MQWVAIDSVSPESLHPAATSLGGALSNQG